MGAYELIRRQIPRIIVCDGGADPDYQFDCLAELVRKVRIDFGARIESFTDDDLQNHVPDDLQDRVGTFADLKTDHNSGKPHGPQENTPHSFGFTIPETLMHLGRC